jgi:hypothetical protein
MSDWKVTGKRMMPFDIVADLISLSLWTKAHQESYIYEIEHVETGETKEVYADDRFQLGEKIADGEWDGEPT